MELAVDAPVVLNAGGIGLVRERGGGVVLNAGRRVGIAERLRSAVLERADRVEIISAVRSRRADGRVASREEQIVIVAVLIFAEQADGMGAEVEAGQQRRAERLDAQLVRGRRARRADKNASAVAGRTSPIRC